MLGELLTRVRTYPCEVSRIDIIWQVSRYRYIKFSMGRKDTRGPYEVQNVSVSADLLDGRLW